MAAGENRRHLPPEIVEEILIKLPVKSLKRFCCVSKSWQSLISDRNFVSKYINLSHKTLVLINPVDDKFCFFHLSSLRRIPKMKKLDSPWGRNKWHLLASCDGLLCIHVDRSVYIWNPSLKYYFRKIPNSTDIQSCNYGLGYDSKTDDYKLLRVPTTLSRGLISETDVYSLKLDTWKEVDNFPLDYFPFCGGVCFNGSIHWLALRRDLRVSTLTCFSFDLSDNKYSETTLPEYSPTHYFVNAKLCVLKGMLCLLAELDPCLVLWAMKDFSDPKSWTKIIDIRLDRAFQLDFTDVKPFYMYKNDHVLMGIVSKHGTELLICKDNTVLFREIIFKEQSLVQYGFVHVESLVSPRPKNAVNQTVENGDKKLCFKQYKWRFLDCVLTCLRYFYSPRVTGKSRYDY